jgi:hypothetical protein
VVTVIVTSISKFSNRAPMVIHKAVDTFEGCLSCDTNQSEFFIYINIPTSVRVVVVAIGLAVTTAPALDTFGLEVGIAEHLGKFQLLKSSHFILVVSR